MLITKTINYSIKYDKLHNTKNSSILLPSIKLKIEENYKKNLYLIHRVLKAQLNQHRQGNANTKTRDEVRGGGKKPWKQKGTGRARAGSNRSPLWRGGGVIFGPQANRTYKSKINKKEKNRAIINILYNKAAHTIVINENFDLLEKPNTKNIINKLSNLNIDIERKILLIVDIKNQILYKSIKNIPNIDIIQADHLNTLVLLKTDLILLTPNGFNQLKNIYNDNT